MDRFSPLHRALGLPPGPLSNDMVDAAVAQGVAEADDLDWKTEQPAEKDLAKSDVVKDIAAMANSGGGLIVFGVDEHQKAATGRFDVGEISESYERTLRRVAVSGIHPPVFGLGVNRLGDGAPRALAVSVPASVDVPHLIYRNDYFGAPIRNHADTEWMRERQLESLYRVRLDERRRAGAALDELYSDAAAGRPTRERAWIVGIARPRVMAPVRARLDRDEARHILQRAESLTLTYSTTRAVHVLGSVDRLNPRPGLRRWVARSTIEGEMAPSRDAVVSVHDDGSVLMAAAIGGGRTADGYDPGHIVESSRCETFVSDLLAVTQAMCEDRSTGDYEIKVGIEWEGDEPLLIATVSNFDYRLLEVSVPVPRFVPIETSIRTDLDEEGLLEQAREIATDVINQGGVQHLRVMQEPAP